MLCLRADFIFIVLRRNRFRSTISVFSCLVVFLYLIIVVMNFIFTEKGFIRDGESSILSPQAFYEYCFRDLEKGASITEEYVKEIASYFIDNLLSSTGIELERERINPSYETEEIDRIASDVPFAVGSRYVDRKWVKRQLDILLSCYRSEIASFRESVDLYFNRKNESLLFPHAYTSISSRTRMRSIRLPSWRHIRRRTRMGMFITILCDSPSRSTRMIWRGFRASFPR